MSDDPPVPRPPTSSVPARWISKSTYIQGRQCGKLLWFRYYARDQIPTPDDGQQAVFDQGHEVGALARRLFVDGLEIGPGGRDLTRSIELTREALPLRRPLFEAAFEYGGTYARADILEPVGDGAWDLFEVKSTTALKEVHLHDVALQRHVLHGAGVNLRHCWLIHLNGGYVRQGGLDPAKLFNRIDVTTEASALAGEVAAALTAQREVLNLSAFPNIPIGPHCDLPYRCALHDVCWASLPDQNVLSLYRGGTKAWQLFEGGIIQIPEIPPDHPLNPKQRIQRNVVVSGEAYVEAASLAAFLATLEYPLHFLDFETFGTAIPLYDGVRPYQQVPFQFSLHIQDAPGATPRPTGFLARGSSDPRPEFLRQLRDQLGPTGSILSYNAPFELQRLAECANAFPEFAPWITTIRPRFVDLLIPFRAFRYYHPTQRGSASLKAVLPALTGRSYAGLAIPDGSVASREFLRINFGLVTPEEETRVRQNLETYCAQDTAGMVEIIARLQKLAEGIPG